MNTYQIEKATLSISQEKLLAFVGAIIGSRVSRDNDEDPLPPGPWDPYVRVALKQIYIAGGPQPEPWKIRESTFGRPASWRLKLASILRKHPEAIDAINGGHHFGDEVSLNPQPLPPRTTFLLAVAQAVITRAELLQELAAATAREDEQRGIIIVGGYISRFTDDFCGTNFRLKYPFPGPRPHWFTSVLDGIDLAVIATQFDQAARETFNPELQQHLARASTNLLDAGLLKLQ